MKSEKSNRTRAIPELSVDVKLVYQRVREMAPGAVISYVELSEVVHRNIQTDGRWILQRARHKAQREDKIVTECVKNEGVKRLDDAGIVASSSSYVKRTRGAAKRGAIKIGSVRDYNSLSEYDRVQHDAAATVLGLILMCSSPSKVKQLEGAVKKMHSELPSADAIKLLS